MWFCESVVPTALQRQLCLCDLWKKKKSEIAHIEYLCDPAWNAETLSIGGGETHGHMYQVHFWNSPWFLNELGPCFASATLGQALTVLCASSTKVCLKDKRGCKQTLFELWVQCKHRQRTRPLCEMEGTHKRFSHCKHSQLSRVSSLCACTR